MTGVARAAQRTIVENVSVAGEAACCDPRGVLVFPDLALLVVADLHLEKGASFARRGVLLPPYDTAVTLARLADAVFDHAPRTVVCLGDSFHRRDSSALMPEPYRASLAALMAGRNWIWVSGNHDPDVPVGVGGDSAEEIALGPLRLRHEPSARDGSGEIAGHLHPCARIVQRGRSVRRRCFVGDGRRMILPAFGAFTGSMNVLDRAFSGLFSRESLIAYMLGADRIYGIGGHQLRAG